MNREKRIFKIEDFKKCPKCQSLVLFKDNNRLECGKCGLILTQNCCFTKQGDIMNEETIGYTIRQRAKKNGY